jgi:NAD(P)H-hydrate repair Nnr-like enzyme with NAD(P)H-hydrate dehydratase domain
MHTPPTSSRQPRVAKGKRRPPLRPLPFKVFIGYTDLGAVRNATDTIADAVRAASRRFQIQPMLWRCDQLASAHWRDRAIRAAQEADVIVLASSGGLSAGVEDWVNAFLIANRGHRATIIAISGPADAWTISIEEKSETKQSVVITTPKLAYDRAALDRDLVVSRR